MWNCLFCRDLTYGKHVQQSFFIIMITVIASPETVFPGSYGYCPWSAVTNAWHWPLCPGGTWSTTMWVKKYYIRTSLKQF